MKLIIVSAFAVGLLASPAAAQIGVEGNLADVDGEFGGELGFTYDLIESGGFTLRPAIGAFLYDKDEPAGRRTVCRENINGNVVASSDCDNNSIKAYGRIELLYSLPIVQVGGGVRLSDDLHPYATLGFSLAPFVKLKGNIGPDYYAGGVTVGF